MRFSFITTFCLMAFVFSLGSLDAQVAPTVRVAVKDIKSQDQKTPQFQAGGVKDHPSRQKTWLEIDMEMDVDKTKTATDNTTMVDALEVKFFIGLNGTDANKKNYVLTGNMTLQNIPTKAGEHAHVLAFVSPNTLRRLLGDSKQFNSAVDIKAVAVEISHGGQIVGGYPVGQGKWWEDLSKFAVIDGEILPKSKTPFAPLWGDYDVEVKTR